MSDYVGHFIDGPGQLLALGAVAVVWVAFSVLGAAVAGRDRGGARLAEADHLVGWALVGSAYTLLGVFTDIPFTLIAICAGGLALAAAAFVWRRDGAVLPDGWWRVVLLGLPLLVLVSAMRGSQWDDFGHWLVIPRYLLATDAFPAADNPFTKAPLAAYPYNWHLVSYLASRVGGGLVESAGALFNVLLSFAFGLMVVRLIKIGAGRDDDSALGWTGAAVAILTTTLINPTFAQKVVLTAYAETSTAVATGTGVVVAWFMLEALAAGDRAAARRLALALGAVLALLVNLKQATLVLTVLIVFATLIVALRDRAVPIGRLLRLLPVIVLPAAVVYLAWRYHVGAELKGREMAIQPFSAWLIHLIPQIVGKMLLVLSKKGYYLALGAVLVAACLHGLWRSKTPFHRFAALAGLVFLGYNAFLLFAYVATFDKFDALRAASYWRYNMHLGMVVVAFGAYGLAALWRHKGQGRLQPGRWGVVAVVLVVIAPVAFAGKLRFDQVPTVTFLRAVGADVAAMVKPGDGVYVVDPAGSGESGVITSYELGERAAYLGYVSAFSTDKIKALKRMVANADATLLLVHSVVPGYAEVLGRDVAPGQSHLLRRPRGGAWQPVKSWPQPQAK